MKYLILLLSLISTQVFSQITKDYYFDQDNSLSGNFIQKHPSDGSYYTAFMKTSSVSGGAIIGITKLDENGNSIWYSTLSEEQFFTSISGICDIEVTDQNIFVGAQYFLPEYKGKIYKFDINGVFQDSLVITDSDNYERHRTEMEINSDSELCFVYSDWADSVHYCTIDPSNLSILTKTYLGDCVYLSNQAYRHIWMKQDDSNTIVGFKNHADSIKFVTLDSDGAIQSSFSINETDDLNAFLIGNNGNIKCITSNPDLEIIEINMSGSIVSTDSYSTQDQGMRTDLAEDDNGDLIVISRGPAVGGFTGGAIMKVGTSLDYEINYPEARFSDLIIVNDQLKLVGVSSDIRSDCQEDKGGLVFASFKQDESPSPVQISPGMQMTINYITPTISSVANNFTKESTNQAGYEVPVFSGSPNFNSTIYWTELMIAGQGPSDNIHSSCQQFFNVFTSGPITTQSDYDQVERDQYDRVWVITKQQIDDHIQAYIDGNPAYETPEVILNWPAHGETSKGQDADLARFKDINNNETYDPLEGEYPLIKGDFCALSVYNDINSDTAENCISNSDRMGVQVYEYVYGYDCSQDSALFNSIYVYYEIINKSGENYDSTFIGNYVDFDIGQPNNDYIGTDPSRGMIYGFDGELSDTIRQGMSILGSYQNPDATDNTVGIGTNESVNGFGYGDGIVDNERLGMTNSVAPNLGGSATGDANTILDYYYYLQSIWKDGSHQTYGGTGYMSSGIESDYAYPDNDDYLFAGTGGTDPGADWSEISEGNPIGDRRMYGSSGPFDLMNGDTLFYDVVYVTGLENGSFSSHEMLEMNTDSARAYFHDNITPCGSDFDFYEPFDGPYPNIGFEEPTMSEISIYPNPTESVLNVINLPVNGKITVYDLNGNLILQNQIIGSQMTLDVAKIPSGTYLIQVIGLEKSEHLKFIKL